MGFSVGSFNRRATDGGMAPSIASGSPVADCWHISLRFTLDAFRHGVDPLAIVRRLRARGERITIAMVDDRLPIFSAMQPQSCHLGFEISLATNATRAELEALFEPVRNDCIVRILAPNRRASDILTLINSLPQEARLGDILVECGAISREALDLAIRQQAGHQEAPGEARRHRALGEILVDQQTVAPEVLDAALERQSAIRSGRPSAAQERLRALVAELTQLGRDAQVLEDDPRLLRAALQQMSQLALRLRNALDENPGAEP